MNTGQRIKNLRIQLGFTQEELGQKIGVKKAAIQKYENGTVENIKRSKIKLLADVLNTTPSYIMGWNNEKIEVSVVTMKISSTSKRLKEIMSNSNIRQVDILKMAEPYKEEYGIKLNKSDLSQYVSGKTKPNQDKLFLLSKILDVSSSWLMGFNVPQKIDNNNTSKESTTNNKSTDFMNIAAHVDGDPLTEEEQEEIINFIKFIKSKRKDNA